MDGTDLRISLEAGMSLSGFTEMPCAVCAPKLKSKHVWLRTWDYIECGQKLTQTNINRFAHPAGQLLLVPRCQSHKCHLFLATFLQPLLFC